VNSLKIENVYLNLDKMRIQISLLLIFAFSFIFVRSLQTTNVRQPEHEDKRELLEDLLNQFKNLVLPANNAF
jgi:hypothetical protein